MKAFELVSKSPEQTQELGRSIGELALPGDVFLLVGKLGAGKTCLTQGIAWGLGIDEYASSPTFVIMRELYGRLPVYHVDLYRLDDIEESLDLGLDDYLYGRGICVVEWAEKALSILPRHHLLINISYLSESDTGRSIQMEANGQRYLEMVDRLRDSAVGSQGG
ncbi:MAG: tRNA (adenosine(37)-N6)-threonylcarbamoyltransferase complex ATPase subunit type 1 TsaE [Dehalococcoidales bacterium]|jgi:tRNA threonylcarbamoyladenosine biosynthesis protein TsaE|nr:tRNA (adenosine(37)-N6)-threonylcarbamoyltransferase complex ATPase subunit type 1 TsaE [Dehalococcoidales bacterium]MDP6126781.1 tRNA (adenosine(37)-N6)-threonylcarbamoyltransferase complex ATPase subunit type 1 TsaE [Dehalococcoidales bacterium]MDP6632321.1 tRNA (adenosine(37)-N6)-threonylcarbamoyltransferase complex ATPase subunit type 1 TsaE [Dehalococcoidales bacterium]